MKQGMIFDMDGTLWDSAENVAMSWNEAILESGISQKVLTAKDIQNVMGKTMDVIGEILFPEIEPQKRAGLLEDCYLRENDYLRIHGGILYEKVEETLAVLRETYHLYIVSNCQKGYIEAFLDHYGFWDYFEDVECYGNTLLQKGDNIRLVVERNRLDRSVYIGDIQGDYDASRAAGIGFIHASYGFGTISVQVPVIEKFAELAGFNW